jgi:tetratricopeptide (TPR) repeat protein
LGFAKLRADMHISRSFCQAIPACLGLLLATTGPAGAAEPDSAEHVFARHSDVSLRDGNQHLAKSIPGVMYEVIQRRGNWLWTGRGWLRHDEAIPLDEAVSYFQTAADADKTYFALVNRARAKYELRDYNGGLGDCDEALRAVPGGAAALSMRGRILLRLNRRDEALADLDQAIRHDAGFAQAYATRAHAWIEAGEFNKAVDDATRAIHLDPSSAWALAARGKALCQWSQFELAIADYDQALKINPNLHAMWNNRANAYFKKGEFNRAVVDYTVAIRLAPSAQLYFNRAIAWARLGRPDMAEQDHRQSARLDLKFAPPSVQQASASRQPGV